MRRSSSGSDQGERGFGRIPERDRGEPWWPELLPLEWATDPVLGNLDWPSISQHYQLLEGWPPVLVPRAEVEAADDLGPLIRLVAARQGTGRSRRQRRTRRRRALFRRVLAGFLRCAFEGWRAVVSNHD